MPNRTNVERRSDRDLFVTRIVNGPPRLVFEAWTRPDLFQRWWVPKSLGLTLLSCEMDVRVGGKYRLVFRVHESEMAFFGTYREVVPWSRLVWTNEEGAEVTVTTVTLTEEGGKTVVAMTEVYPSKEALDAAMSSGMPEGTCETFGQLEEFIVAQGINAPAG